MTSRDPVIIGAGLSGLIAAHAWPRAQVLERAAAAAENHKAVLRFRGEGVSALTGIEFRRVMVRKALWSAGAFHAPTPYHANAYSAKVLGRITGDRSVWALDPVERWIAPPDFYLRLVEAVGSRISWNASFSHSAPRAHFGPIVSTAALPETLAQVGLAASVELRFSKIVVRRYRVHDCDTFQTIYFPDLGEPLYRASITGDLLIAESMSEQTSVLDEQATLERVFGIPGRAERIEKTAVQRYGKIAPLDDAMRRALLLRLTTEHGIYSLGRFATWRNVLLDDLIHDIAVIKRLSASDHYAARVAAAQ